MELRAFLREAAGRGWVRTVEDAYRPDEALARRIHAAGEDILLFEQPYHGYRLASGVCASRRYFALAFGVEPAGLLSHLVHAVEHPGTPAVVDDAPCREVVEADVNLERLPILRHTPLDGGRYITAGVMVTPHPEGGLNIAYHRLMLFDSRRMAVRLVEGRHTHTIWSQSSGDVPAAVCIGAPLSVQLAAALSPPSGRRELDIAAALAPTPLTRCPASDLLVPAESEIVLEGRLTHTLVAEGPFLDLTGTFDIVREQPVLEIDRITHRRDPIYQALLPGGIEHKTLMGMPREPTIFAAVEEVAECRGVYITPGGCSWLHAVVAIHKRRPDDGRRAAEAAFRGHSSLKHVVVVDDDVDIFSPEEVEWAIATRFQAHRDLMVWEDRPSSSLDPSARHIPGQKARTAKMALDATIPWEDERGPAGAEAFRRYRYEEGGRCAHRDR